MIIGPGIGGDCLGNAMVGGSGYRKWSLRFRAEQTSRFSYLLFPFLSTDARPPGYGAGTGGRWRLSLYHDDGSRLNAPLESALAGTIVTEASPRSVNAFRVAFANPPLLVRRRLYHFVFENIDADPVHNYFSVNTWTRQQPDDLRMQPRFADTDWALLYRAADGWKLERRSTPIADIAYENGAHQGMSYGEASYRFPGWEDDLLVGRIAGDSSVRQLLVAPPGGPHRVTGFGVRLLRLESTVDALEVSLRDASGFPLATASVPASAVPTGPEPLQVTAPSNDDVGQRARWIHGGFDGPAELRSGETYFLQLSSPHGAFLAWPQRRLVTEYGYHASTAPTVGWAEFNRGDGAWRLMGRVPQQFDLQCFLETTPASNVSAIRGAAA